MPHDARRLTVARRWSSALAAILVLTLTGCGSNGQSTLDPHSKQAGQITNLWWGMAAAAAVVMLGACLMLGVAWRRRRRTGLPIIGENESANTRLVVVFGIVIPIVSVVVLFGVANFGVAQVTDAPAKGTTKLTLDVVGHQWFWQFRYHGSKAVIANELHIPVGVAIDARVRTADVIHSFWVPELNRKVDAIPGRTNQVEIYADRPGVYRGQCAEFCGLQHAHMSFAVYAQPPDQFRAWLAAQEADAQRPASGEAITGARTFAANACASCHTIRGTSARGRLGPDLTHLASRQTIGALAVPNDPAHLLEWISDPQHLKPGVKMPGLDLTNAQFRAIAAYLETLK